MKLGKNGSIIKRGNFYSLQLNHNNHRVTRVIRDPDTDKSITTKEDALKYQAATADAIRKELSGSGVTLSTLSETYMTYLPNYKKRKGVKHEDATKDIPISPATLRGNLEVLQRFIDWIKLDKPKSDTLMEATQDRAERYFASLRKEGFKESTYNRYLMALRHVFNVLPQTRENNPFKALSTASTAEINSDKTPKERFTLEEIKKIGEKATGWIRLAAAIGLHSGLRLGDVVTLKYGDIDKDGFITKRNRKTGKSPAVFCPLILPYLSEWKEQAGDITEDSYIFPDIAKGYIKDRSAAVKLFQRFLTDDCEIETKDSKGQTVKGFHSFRVTNATLSRLGGQSIEQIQKKLAHESAAVTNGYIQETAAEIKKRLISEYKPIINILEA